jgi:hypothetical protein
MRKVYIFNEQLINAEALPKVNELLASQGVKPINPTIIEVPDDAKFADIVNGAFSISAYNERKARELNENYESRVVVLIREKYSLDQELAILRQRDTKPIEFSDYNSYVEMCKTQAKLELNLPL